VRTPVPNRWVSLLALLAAVPAHAGMFRDSLFRQGADTVHCVVADSVLLAIRFANTMRLEYGPVRPNRSTTTPKTPDVTSLGKNRFRFFWTDSAVLNGSGPKIYRRDVTIVDTGAIVADTVNVSGPQGLGSPLGYLHADAGDTNSMVTVIEKNATLMGYSSKSKNVLDSIGKPEMIANASQCRLRPDTFMVIYTKSNQFVKGKKVYFNGTMLGQQTGEVSFASNQYYCINPTIAADSSLNMVALWMQGPRDSVKRLSYAYYDSSFTFHDSATLSGTIGEKGQLNYYDEAPVVSYARKKFAAVSWDPAGIVLRRFEIKTAQPLDTVSVDYLRPPSLPGSRFPTLASNGRYLAILWREGTAPGAGSIKGVRYPIVNGSIDTAAMDAIVSAPLSAALDAIDTVSINCSMDSSGNLGVCWQISHAAQVGALARRNILFDSGSWTSAPIRLPAGLRRDSIYFDSAIITTGAVPTGTVCRGLLLLGPDSSAMTDSVAFTNGVAMKTATKGLHNFYRYRLSLAASPNLLKTPTIKKVFLQWNVKPRIDTLAEARVNGARVNAGFGDTVTVMSRIDTVFFTFKALDADGDFVYSTVTCRNQTVIDSFFGLAAASSMARILPLPKSDSILSCRFGVVDKKGWPAQDSVLYIKTRNSAPVLRVRAVLNGSSTDTTEAGAQVNLNVQQSDSVEFIYSIRDTNDIALKAYVNRNGTIVDSADQTTEKHFIFRCSNGRPQGDQFTFVAVDPDTTIVRRVLCGVNHFPHIDSMSLKGTAVHGGDTLRVSLDSPFPIVVHASDPDVGYWDTLTYSYRRGARDTSLRDSFFVYNPSPNDSMVTVIVSDLFGIRDSLRFFIKFPWYENDSGKNAGLYASRKLLSTGVSLIVGGGVTDTIAVPVKNTGNDTLSLISIRFSAAPSHWLRMLIPQSSGLRLYDSLPPNISPVIACAPDSVVTFYAVFLADSLKGDGLVFDTIIITTNDARHGADTLPVRLEYNDMPRITSVSVVFTQGKPYWLAKSKSVGYHSPAYVFPPHAKISLQFSEPMDSVSALGAISVYSVFDSMASSRIIPIPLSQTWSQGKTVLSLSPRYSLPSPYFHVMPTAGLFIPTDSIRLVVSTGITDTAKTPSGPNGLDIHRVAQRIVADTTFSYRVDSVTFALVSVFPDSVAKGVAPATPIVLKFSSPPLFGTVDTAKKGNRSLIVWSAYSGVTPLFFSGVTQRNDTVTFVPAKRFFYGDTVFCRYRAVTARDSLGYPASINSNGIPPSLFDTGSSQGDKRWFFVIKDVVHTAVYPPNGAVNVGPDSALHVLFDDTLRRGTIDTSLTGNRTLIITSRCGNGAVIDFRSIQLMGTGAVFYPAYRLYYGDSVHCSYKGLSTIDTSAYAIGGSMGTVLYTKDKIEWSFSIKNINLVSVTPDSAKVSASIHPDILLQFSDPLYPGVFDADTSNRNRSFRITSTYGKDTLLSLKSVSFSADGRQARIRPGSSFFSNDSVHCVFAGFLKTIAYGGADNLPAAGASVTCAYVWPFFIQNAGFYTFPNPYKPGSDPRHCSANGPCGIWFKNLHTLKRGITEVGVKIFSMDAHPLYGTKAAGVRIQFATGNADLRPEWKWDTRNQRGSLVASGLYFYAIYDVKDNVLMRGKLMIVR